MQPNAETTQEDSQGLGLDDEKNLYKKTSQGIDDDKDSVATDEGYQLDYEDYLETTADITIPETLQFSTGDPDPSPLDDSQESCDSIEEGLVEEAIENAAVEAIKNLLNGVKEETIPSTEVSDEDEQDEHSYSDTE